MEINKQMKNPTAAKKKAFQRAATDGRLSVSEVPGLRTPELEQMRGFFIENRSKMYPSTSHEDRR